MMVDARDTCVSSGGAMHVLSGGAASMAQINGEQSITRSIGSYPYHGRGGGESIVISVA
jgi:autotransporter passenger strand-loop-strand repeat protein